MHKNESIENYLEAIYILNKQKRDVRAIDLVDYFTFSRATVSVALKKLKNNGFINIIDNYISLSEKGEKLALMTYEKHILIAEILMHLGVDEKIAYNDACMIEHDLSEKSFSAIKEYYKKFIKNK